MNDPKPSKVPALVCIDGHDMVWEQRGDLYILEAPPGYLLRVGPEPFPGAGWSGSIGVHLNEDLSTMRIFLRSFK